MKDKLQKFLLIIFIIFFIVFSIIYYEKNLKSEAEDKKVKSEIKNNNSPQNDTNKTGAFNEDGNKENMSGGGSGGGVSESDSILKPGKERENINIEEEECGFYFSKYGVCGGTCPKGVCVQEGGSCYCKKI